VFTLQARRSITGLKRTAGVSGSPSGGPCCPIGLRAAGVSGLDVGRLQKKGALDVGDRRVTLEEVSVPQRGQRSRS
jgi:ribonuclease Z